MRLKELLKKSAGYTLKGTSNPVITGLCSHSKALKPGELYVALKGVHFDGRDFIPEALKAKASGVITDLYNPLLDKKFVQIITPDPKRFSQELALTFYHTLEPLIAVTGTNGKTTVSFCLKQLLDALGLPCALIGTCYIDTLSSITESSLTTPEAIQFTRIVDESARAGAKALIAEVSSHALDQHRVLGHKFDTVIFTNLTRDHLDYHKSMEAYAEAKLKLFTSDYYPPSTAQAVINLDDPFSLRLVAATKRRLITYSLKNATADFFLSELVFSVLGQEALLHHKGKSYPICSSLVGQFNASNLLAVIATASIYCPLETVLEKLAAIKGAPGRLEKVSSNIYVDFAHTPDGLESVLHTVKQLQFKKICVLFGCGGNRDPGKRALMGQIAEKLADQIILTSDNPRHEEPLSIIKQIALGINDGTKYQIIVDRRQAIEQTIAQLDPDTLLLIAGKGHEKTQTIGYQSLPFDDVELAKSVLSAVELTESAHKMVLRS